MIVLIAAYVVHRDGLGTDEKAVDATPPPIRSLAVLPLRNIANNTRDEFLSVGLADALVTKLQHIPSLQVRPTS